MTAEATGVEMPWGWIILAAGVLYFFIGWVWWLLLPEMDREDFPLIMCMWPLLGPLFLLISLGERMAGFRYWLRKKLGLDS